MLIIRASFQLAAIFCIGAAAFETLFTSNLTITLQAICWLIFANIFISISTLIKD